jgi:SAM-dependent methyltransferase
MDDARDEEELPVDGAPLYENRARASSFGADAELYDRVRPTYPPALIDELLAGGAIDVVDVGCGTGISSRLFIDRGCRVLGVEADPRMAAVARATGVDVEVAPFEDWEAAGRTFDLLVAAQAWHWVHPAKGSEKAAVLIRPGGRVGHFWNRGRHEPAVHDALESAYRQHASELVGRSIILGAGTAERFDASLAALAATGAFHDLRIMRFPWTKTYTTEGWLDHISTHSDHSGLPAESRAALYAAIGVVLDARGGGSTVQYHSVLITGTRS